MFNEKLAVKMSEQGVSTPKLAKHLGYSESKIYKGWLKSVPPTIDDLIKLSQFFDVHISYWLDDEANKYFMEAYEDSQKIKDLQTDKTQLEREIAKVKADFLEYITKSKDLEKMEKVEKIHAK